SPVDHMPDRPTSSPFHPQLREHALPLRRERRPLTLHVGRDRIVQPRLPEKVRTPRDRRLETTRQLGLSTRARPEHLEPSRQALLDAAVVADVEVQEAHLLRRTPISPIQPTPAREVDRPTERLSALPAPREHELHRAAHPPRRDLEELAIQILVPPVK